MQDQHDEQERGISDMAIFSHYWVDELIQSNMSTGANAIG
jgi:hypothetical protein